jgi:hypothetical protein
MSSLETTMRRGVAGVRLTASAQPPRATSVFTPRPSSSQSPQSISPTFVLLTNGARQESLGCCGLPSAPPKEMDLNYFNFCGV